MTNCSQPRPALHCARCGYDVSKRYGRLYTHPEPGTLKFTDLHAVACSNGDCSSSHFTRWFETLDEATRDWNERIEIDGYLKAIQERENEEGAIS